MDPQQLRTLIKDVLVDIDMYSINAVELLMLTAAQESHCGRWLEQMDGGPARGIFQMQPSTLKDLFRSYLRYKPNLYMKAYRYMYVIPTHKMSNIAERANIPQQIVMARLHYRRFPEPLPDYKDIDAMAAYYKQYWNTDKGKATVGEAINNYTKYAL